jgi:hypothetical protein
MAELELNMSVRSGIEALIKTMEADMFYGPDARNKNNLKVFLGKLGIKSARDQATRDYLGGGPLQIESLEATLKNVTFDDKKIKLWGKK